MTDKTKYIIKIIASTITILAIIGYGIFAFVKLEITEHKMFVTKYK